MHSEIVMFLTLLVLLITSLVGAVANWRLQSTVREMARLMASRSFTDYAVGTEKLNGKKKEPVEHSQDYAAVWGDGADK